MIPASLLWFTRPPRHGASLLSMTGSDRASPVRSAA